MPDKPVLSIIVPHLNAPEALGRCLASLAAQCNDRLAFEVIVVDNGSDVLPDAVCDGFDFVRLAEESTAGPGPARSRGAHLARAELLAFIDSDCIAEAGWVENIVDYFRTHPEAAVVGGEVLIHRADPARPTMIEAYESVYGYRMKLYIERDHYPATCNMAVRCDIFRRVGDFAGIAIAEDMDWGRRATAMGVRIEYVPDIRIATPARATFRELARKWDRHIGHDYAKVDNFGGQMRWMLRALALGVSPVSEIFLIATSGRVSGLRERGLALLCLSRIRFHRCTRMLGLLASNKGQTLPGVWRNRG